MALLFLFLFIGGTLCLKAEVLSDIFNGPGGACFLSSPEKPELSIIITSDESEML